MPRRVLGVIVIIQREIAAVRVVTEEMELIGPERPPSADGAGSARQFPSRMARIGHKSRNTSEDHPIRRLWRTRRIRPTGSGWAGRRPRLRWSGGFWPFFASTMSWFKRGDSIRFRCSERSPTAASTSDMAGLGGSVTAAVEVDEVSSGGPVVETCRKNKLETSFHLNQGKSGWSGWIRVNQGDQGDQGKSG